MGESISREGRNRLKTVLSGEQRRAGAPALFSAGARLAKKFGMSEKKTVSPSGRRGKYKTYAAKIGTMGSSVVLVKRIRSFYVGQRIEYVNEDELRGMCVSVAPRWRSGIIWLIEDRRLFIKRI